MNGVGREANLSKSQARLLRWGHRYEADTHHGVTTLFGLHLAKTGTVPPKLGRYLNNLNDDRESGDYDVYSGIDRGVAEDAVREAREFLPEAERYLAFYLSGPQKRPKPPHALRQPPATIKTDAPAA